MDLNHQPRAYETLALPLSYTALVYFRLKIADCFVVRRRSFNLQSEICNLQFFWGPAEELNLVPLHPALKGIGLEDRCRERGPQRQ